MNKRLARLESLIWTLIYGGLLVALVGWFVLDGGDASGQWLMGIGGVAAAIGFVLILVRSRLHEEPDADAQASARKREP